MIVTCNPCRSLILAREVQPPHIYVRGDGRLNQANNRHTYQYNLLFTLITFVPASVIRRLSKVHRISTTKLRAVKSGLAQPIDAGTSDGVPPEEPGLRVSKASACCLAYRAVSRPPAGRVAEHLPRLCGYTRACSCKRVFSATHG